MAVSKPCVEWQAFGARMPCTATGAQLCSLVAPHMVCHMVHQICDDRLVRGPPALSAGLLGGTSVRKRHRWHGSTAARTHHNAV
eukprot:2336948-Lingulodinium_polyedra.AAC.1